MRKFFSRLWKKEPESLKTYPVELVGDGYQSLAEIRRDRLRTFSSSDTLNSAIDSAWFQDDFFGAIEGMMIKEKLSTTLSLFAASRDAISLALQNF
ncbi:hypothetical protein [Coxiella burnetii]|uniref:hypothetical protein n=1 Tax=Coxiella burnetii TaxID=777 RepID=UPI0021762D37|nr:hypothetical protein [Coxiella burnetii]